MNNKFLIDEQTKKDIQLTNIRGNSIFDFFNHTKTEGGNSVLRDLFYSPTTNLNQIIDRQIKIERLLPFVECLFHFDRLILKDLEKFLAFNPIKSTFLPSLNIFRISTPEYFYTKRSILETFDVLSNFNIFLAEILKENKYEDIGEYYKISTDCLKKFFNNSGSQTNRLKINLFNIDSYNTLIHFELAKELKSIIKFLYEIDAYLAIAKAVKDKTFCFPVLTRRNETEEISINGLYNIFHKSPVANDILMMQSKKTWFLTGANMAGKSSLIKSISAAIYLTHIGFPVPALFMATDVLDGLFTSINLDDNIDLGYSHFYNEAIRLKEIVDQLSKESNALIILDELFKGTNNDDASQAIFEVIKYFVKIDGPFTIISSHITELSEKLKQFNGVNFIRLNIERDNEGMPFFSYKISEGVSHEKLGMWLLNKSGVFTSFKELVK